MTAQDFKRAIQNEIKTEGFGNKISDYKESDTLHDIFVFEQPVTTELFQWLNVRFLYGVTAIDKMTIQLNHPNENNKEKETQTKNSI